MVWPYAAAFPVNLMPTLVLVELCSPPVHPSMPISQAGEHFQSTLPATTKKQNKQKNTPEPPPTAIIKTNSGVPSGLEKSYPSSFYKDHLLPTPTITVAYKMVSLS